MRAVLILAAAGIVLAATVLAGCGAEAAAPATGAGGGKPAARAFPVAVATVVEAEADVVVRSPGTVEPQERVQVVARVDGMVESVAFREGDRVDADTVLAIIDAERYALAAEVAAAGLQIAEAELVEAVTGNERRDALGDRVSQDERALWQARRAVAEARVRQRRAEVALADLDRRHTRVRAAVPGVIQERLVQTGAQVDAGDVIATLLRDEPPRLHFTVTVEQAGDLSLGTEVACGDPAGPAVLRFIGGEADPATRRVAVIADCAAGSTLRPGAFVDVAITAARRRLPVVPLSAIVTGEDGHVVYVVDGDRVRRTAITPGRRGEDGRCEVLSGIEAGQVVVVRGAQSLGDGAAIRVVEQVGG